MDDFEQLLERAGAAFDDGLSPFVLGRKGSALLCVVLTSLFPFCLSNLLWVGLMALIGSFFLFPDGHVPWPWGLAVVISLVAGAKGLLADLEQLAKMAPAQWD